MLVFENAFGMRLEYASEKDIPADTQILRDREGNLSSIFPRALDPRYKGFLVRYGLVRDGRAQK